MGEVQEGGEIGRCHTKYGFVNELKPMAESSGVEGCPVY